MRRSPAGIATPAAPRLACVKPVASVHPEPGSNSSLFKLFYYPRSGIRYCSPKSAVKVCGSTIELPLKLGGLSMFEAGGMRGVAVKGLDITQNPDREGSLPSHD